MDTFMGTILGLLVFVLLNGRAKSFNTAIKKKLEAPAPNERYAGAWAQLLLPDGGGDVLGCLERIAFFLAVLAEHGEFVGVWLLFKVAAKWEVWSTIVRLPENLPAVDPMKYLVARRRLAARVLMSFLIGTLYNVIAGFVPAAVILGHDALFVAARATYWFVVAAC